MFALIKKKEPTHYEKELTRINKKLEGLEIGSEEYTKVLDEKTKLVELEGKQIAMKQKFTKEGRGKLAVTALSALGLGGITYGLARFQLKGNMFTGENKTCVNGIVKIASKIFFGV